MFRVLAGFAVGYILGARAGRARYDQINTVMQRVADHPAVQGAAGFLLAKASGLLHPGCADSRPNAGYLEPADYRPSTPTRPDDQVDGHRLDEAGGRSTGWGPTTRADRPVDVGHLPADRSA